MNGNGAYGDVVAEHFRLGSAHSSQLVSIGPNTSIAVTRLMWGAGGLDRTLQLAQEEAIIIILQLEALPEHKLWFGQKLQPVEPWAKGTMSMVHLEQLPTASVAGASDVLQFYIPRASLVAAAEQDDAQPIRSLRISNGTDDPTVFRLGCMMLPVLRNPNEVNVLFLTGLATALHAHLRKTYGATTDGYTYKRRVKCADLSRAKEMIRADLTGNFPLAVLASECNLPPTSFAQAFKRSTGMLPHSWLLRQRVEYAKNLMKLGNANQGVVAVRSGFVNVQHFNRVFSAIVGVSPSQWILKIR